VSLHLPLHSFLFCATIILLPCVKRQRSTRYGLLPTEQCIAAHSAVPSPRAAYGGHYSCAASAVSPHVYHLREAVHALLHSRSRTASSSP